MPKPHVYVFSGLMSSIISGFRKGTKEIASDIRHTHPEMVVKHYIWNEWDNVFEEILQRALSHGNSDVYLIGHINGVLACANIAEEMRKMNMPVKYIGAIDPTSANFPKLGSNVSFVDEFWAKTGWPAVKRKISGNTDGACTFRQDFKGKHTLIKVPTTHVGASSSNRTQKRIIGSVRELAGS